MLTSGLDLGKLFMCKQNTWNVLTPTAEHKKKGVQHPGVRISTLDRFIHLNGSYIF